MFTLVPVEHVEGPEESGALGSSDLSGFYSLKPVLIGVTVPSPPTSGLYFLPLDFSWAP